MNVPLSSPEITQEDIKEVMDVLKSGRLSIGPRIEEFERLIAKYVGVKYAIGVNSGTSALHLILRSLEIGEGDLVITTPFSFVASSNVMFFEKALPIFADIDPNTLNLSPKAVNEVIENLRKGKMSAGKINVDPSKLRAILVVDVFGQPADWDEFEKIAEENGLELIEDSCEAIGAEYKGRKVGTFGSAGAFAFYPNKQITTGEGGVIVTNDEKIHILSRSMRNQGRGEGDEWLTHSRLGYNYRLDEMSAALGVSQLRRLDAILRKREKVAQIYNELLSNVKGIETPYISSATTKMSWFVYVVKLDKNIDRDKVMEYLKENGIQTRPYFLAIHLQKFYRETFGYSEGYFPVTEDVSKRTLALPFFNNISREVQEYVVEKLKEAIEKFCR
ncbi:MAG: DegT/DnrJ/EryC1/StrS family aminotransferase [Thermotogae bacterium]|nr:DegT/DnrJ/EryC1/StrS family aminotransferase [Thermotogota bacterium]